MNFDGLAADAARYRWLRSALYRQNIDIGEARLSLHVVGCCPTLEEFDSEIDAAMAAERITLTEAGRAALKGGE